MTRRGAHRGGYGWGGGGVPVDRQFYSELLGWLESKLAWINSVKLNKRAWTVSRDRAHIESALVKLAEIKRLAPIYERQARKFQLLAATRLAQRILKQSHHIYSDLLVLNGGRHKMPRPKIPKLGQPSVRELRLGIKPSQNGQKAPCRPRKSVAKPAPSAS